MLKLLALGLMLACGFAYASETPAPVQTSQPQKAHAAKADQEGNQQHPVTGDVPLSVTIKSPITVEQSKSERDEDRKEANKEESHDRWIARGTVALAIATGVLAIVTLFLAVFTFLLWKEAIKSGRAWLSIRTPEVFHIHISGAPAEEQRGTHWMWGSIRFEIANSGDRPATGMLYHCLMYDPAKKDETQHEIEQFIKTAGDSGQGGMCIAPGDSISIERDVMMAITEPEEGVGCSIGTSIAIIAVYRDSMDSSLHVTVGHYFVSRKQNGATPCALDFHEIENGTQEIKILNFGNSRMT